MVYGSHEQNEIQLFYQSIYFEIHHAKAWQQPSQQISTSNLLALIAHDAFIFLAIEFQKFVCRFVIKPKPKPQKPYD